MNKEELNRIGAAVLDAAIYVHRKLGPGLLESAYKKAMKVTLQKRGFHVQAEAPVRFVFDGEDLGEIFNVDLLVDNVVIVELKAQREIAPVHEAQLLTYLKLADKNLGYLINFNVPLLKRGFHRYVRGW